MTVPAYPSAAENPFLYLTCRLCNHTSLDGGKAAGDPLEIALLQVAEHVVGRDFGGYPRLYEVPFDPERKRMTTVHQLPQGTSAVLTKGAVESLLPLCSSVLAQGGIVSLTPARREEMLEAGNRMAGSGLQVLGFAYKEHSATSATFFPESVEKDLIFAGLVGIMDPPRPEVAGAIRRCREAGIRVIMITGDHRLTALAIGREIERISGEASVLEGQELEHLSNSELALADGCQIFARTTPRQKLRIVTVLKDMGEIVAVTGDGVNDGPALKHADIGIAMGVTGTDVAREASQIVLFAADEGRKALTNR